MKDFGQLGLHPGALPGGQNYDVYVTHLGRIQTSILFRVTTRLNLVIQPIYVAP
jgi:hypothetical protein